MFSVYKKELGTFFSSVIGYAVVAVFLVLTGLFVWVFTDTSVVEYHYATLDQFFSLAPLIFLFLIPAITMRSYADEFQRGTMEFLSTKPLKNTDILLGKYFANLTLVLFALLPTLLYYFSIYMLGSPVGNVDSGAIFGSYIGLIFLAASFIAIGIYASAITDNQIVAFILGAFLCFFFHWAFTYLSKLPIFVGGLDAFINKLGINVHYMSMSKGAIDSRDVIYFLSVVVIFLSATLTYLANKKQ